MIDNKLFFTGSTHSAAPQFFFFSFSEHSLEIRRIPGKEFFRNTLFIDTLKPIYRRLKDKI